MVGGAAMDVGVGGWWRSRTISIFVFISHLLLPQALARSNVFVEGVSHKIQGQIEDLERAGGVESGTLTVDGVPVDTYLTRSAACYTV
jgi:hypothetical protein